MSLPVAGGTMRLSTTSRLAGASPQQRGGRSLPGLSRPARVAPLFTKCRPATCSRRVRKPIETPVRAGLSTFVPGYKEYKQKLEAGEDVSEPFGQERWTVHQNSWRHFRHIFDIYKSRILFRIATPLLWVTLMAAIACSFYTYAPPSMTAMLNIPMVPFNVTSATLGLLLVFRTNASYARWDEARKMWGLMVNRTRDMCRQYAVFFPRDEAIDEKQAFMQRWITAFVYSLKCHLRERGDLEGALKDVLPAHELKALMKSGHKPLYTLQCLAAGISGSGASDILKGTMDQNLTAMEDCVGGCERLLRTPIPLPYTRHTTRFLTAWLTLLPFSLYASCGWGTIIISTCIAACMLGVEEIGVTVEEPFKILALDALCATIAANTLSIVKDGESGGRSATKLFKKAIREESSMEDCMASFEHVEHSIQDVNDAAARLESALGQPYGGVVSPTDAMSLMKEGAIHLDVRPANVFARDSYSKAINVPVVKVNGFGKSAEVIQLDSFIPTIQENINPKTPIVVCGGEHTDGAMDQLIAAGFSAYEISGGFAAWTKVYNPRGKLRQPAVQSAAST